MLFIFGVLYFSIPIGLMILFFVNSYKQSNRSSVEIEITIKNHDDKPNDSIK